MYMHVTYWSLLDFSYLNLAGYSMGNCLGSEASNSDNVPRSNNVDGEEVSEQLVKCAVAML